MKILIRNADNAVLFADDSLQLSPTGVSGEGWVARFVDSTNARIEDATLPAKWTGAAYSYSEGVWTVIDQAAIDAAHPAPDPRIAILASIAALESTITLRRTREALLTPSGKTWLEKVAVEIENLRSQLIA